MWHVLALLTLSLLLPAAVAAATNSIQWGVNVHYGVLPDSVPKTQIAEELVTRNMKCVRLDILGDDTNSLAQFRSFAAICRSQNIRVEAILFTPFSKDHARDKDTNASLREIEDAAYASTKHQVERTVDLVQDYELQNEISLYSGIKKQGATGQNAADYDTPLGNRQAAALRGMFKAVDDVRKDKHLPLRIILGTTDRSFGLLAFMQEHGVLFDVVGYHHYPWDKHPPLDQDPWFGPGGPLGQLAKFNKPIVINEFNCGEIYSGDSVHTGQDYENKAGEPLTELGFRSLDKHLREIVNQKSANIEAVLFYELYDEPDQKPPENHFGFYYDLLLTKPKVSLLLVTSFSGGRLSRAEWEELSKRGIGWTDHSNP